MVDDDELIQPVKDTSPFWIWLVLLGMGVLLLSSLFNWVETEKEKKISHAPFYEVTNRSFSLFLWENPQFMRANVSTKQAYLPGFRYLGSVTGEPEQADQWVQAPPDLLFYYHTWDRLVGKEFSLRSFLGVTFLSFLQGDPMWQPCCWKDAPENYKAIVEEIDKKYAGTVPEQVVRQLPLPLLQAFQGWNNFMNEGLLIDDFEPTYADLEKFLTKNPHFERSLWKNLLLKTSPKYLWTYTYLPYNKEDVVPREEMSSFLLSAIFNFVQAEKKE